ncbi:MAG: hypothetical protein IJJ56_09005, partial [Prevotella sp.]|nr:hypothetical protein [Prevotella sp.]
RALGLTIRPVINGTNNETTNIIHSKSSIDDTCQIFYDLQGRRLTQKPEKGVYIQNGRKVIAR